MSIKNNIIFSEEEIRKAILNSPTMGGAAKYLKVDWRTFKKEASRYGLYTPGIRTAGKYELTDILNGLHPQYPTSKITPRLIKEGLKEYKCEICKITSYNSKTITLELNHIDGDNSNHSLYNLQLLCPNCHSQTDTYRNKKSINK
jgi:hypothetical protein